MKTLTRSIFALLSLCVILLAIWLVAIQPEQEARVKAEADARLTVMQSRLSELQTAKKVADALHLAEEKAKAAEEQRLAAEQAKAAAEEATQKKLADLEQQLREEKAARLAELQGGGPNIQQPNNPFLFAPALPQTTVIGVLEDSAGKDNGAISSGVTFVPGIAAGQAMQFNGQDTQVDFGAKAGNVGANDFTIEWWMNTSSVPPQGIQSFLSKRAICDAVNSLDITVGGGMPVGQGRLQLGLQDEVNGSNLFYTTNTLNDGQWHHVAWERQADPGGMTATEKVYVDGKLNNTVADPHVFNIVSATHLVMGIDACVGRNGTVPYRGAADGLQFWNRALTATEITENYQAGLAGKHPPGNGLVNSWSSQNAVMISVKPAPLPSNPIALPPVADGAVPDSVGKNHAAISGGVTLMPGKLGQAFQFNGQDSQIDFGPTTGNFGTADFTLEYWMKGPANPNPQGEAFLSKIPECGLNSHLTIQIINENNAVPGQLLLGLHDEGIAGSVGPSSLRSTIRVSDGQWHQVAWERRADPGGTTCTLLLYVDGQLNTSSPNQPVTVVNTPAHLVMGQNPCIGVDGETGFSGLADGLKIWNRALTAAEITENYQAALAGKHPAGNGLLNSWSAEKAAINSVPPPMVPMIIRGPGIRVRPNNPRPPPVIQPNQIL